MAVLLGQQPVQHGAEGRDPRPGRDENGVAHWRMQNEIPERPLKLDLVAFVEAAEMIRHESFVHTIEAEGNMSVFGGWRRDRIWTGHLLTVRSIRLHRKPLPGNKTEISNSVHFEFEVLGKLGERNGTNQSCFVSFKLSH